MKRGTIRNTLFLTYAVVILAAFLAVAVMLVILEMPRQREQVFSSIRQNTSNITTSMDSELDQMHTLALNIAYSTLVRDRLVAYMHHGSDADTREADAKVLVDLLATLITPNLPVEQLYLYTMQDEIIASGLINGIFSGNASQQQWYQAVQINPHNKVMMYTGEDADLSRYSTYVYGKHFVSLSMQVFDALNAPQGHVEIKKRLSRIIPSAISYESVFGEQIYIFDEFGTLIYPLDDESQETLFSYAKEQGFPTEVATFSTSAGQYNYVCSSSSKSDFYTIAVISRSALLSPIYEQTQRILLVTFITLLFSLILAFFAAKRLTMPIDKICKEVSNFALSQSQPPPSLDIKIIELKSLYQSFCDMRQKLVESVNKQILLQNQEMQSRMIALQAQMNPHFLYNSLSTIQSMADEGMNDEIITMCQSMAGILRYISSDSEHHVSLHEEIMCTKDYLACMDARYQGDLSYAIDIPDEMNDVRVPKLCVQLLVENAIKFTSTNRPPYHISISGILNDERYEVSVLDNGPGFSEEILLSLRNEIANIDATGLLPSLEIRGMGLLNVYIRFKILHKENIIFRFENNLPHGARVTIGERYEKP